MASGSEVGLIVEAGRQLAGSIHGRTPGLLPILGIVRRTEPGIPRTASCQSTVKARLAVEAGVSMGWERWVGEKGGVIAIDRFGASAPAETVYRELGMTVENIVARALSWCARDFLLLVWARAGIGHPALAFITSYEDHNLPAATFCDREIIRNSFMEWGYLSGVCTSAGATLSSAFISR